MITENNNLNKCSETREMASKIIGKVFSESKNSSISETQYRNLLLKELSGCKEVLTEGWYDPPPHGIGVLFGQNGDWNRLQFDSLRKDKFWPNKSYNFEKNTIGIVYLSPIDKQTGIIGDIGLTIYNGTDFEIQKHLAKCLKTTEQVAEYAEVGMEFREIHAYSQRLFKERGLNNDKTLGTTVFTKTSIGHTIPWTYERMTDIEKKIVAAGDSHRLNEIISHKRIHIREDEKFVIPKNIAFTTEVRLESNENPLLPLVFFHLIVIFKNGRKVIHENFNRIFTSMGMDYMESKYDKQNLAIDYRSAGVDIDAADKALELSKTKIKETFTRHVLTGIGGFGTLFDIKEASREYEHPILVQSVDGVGTKLMIAKIMNKYNTVGIDIVSNCCGDLVAMGAKPLTFLDYIANEKIRPEIVSTVISKIADECKKIDVSLIGGETAEMPGVYKTDEIDLVGCVTGIVEKDKIITGENINPGDVLLGFASNGLHTNGYSLARKIIFDIGKYAVDSRISDLDKSIGETLLEPHTNYTKPILGIIDSGITVKGIAHITGGGFIDNIPRILPEQCSVEIKKGTWPILSIFSVLKQIGNVEEFEMYRTFNMGIGMIIVVSGEDVYKIFEEVKKFPSFGLYEIGAVVEGKKMVHIL